MVLSCEDIIELYIRTVLICFGNDPCHLTCYPVYLILNTIGLYTGNYINPSTACNVFFKDDSRSKTPRIEFYSKGSLIKILSILHSWTENTPQKCGIFQDSHLVEIILTFYYFYLVFLIKWFITDTIRVLYKWPTLSSKSDISYFIGWSWSKDYIAFRVRWEHIPYQ